MSPKTTNYPKTITYEELDARLEAAAEDPELFEDLTAQLFAELDEAGIDLEIQTSEHWRNLPATPAGGSRGSFLNQFRSDVDSIQQLDREEEGRLARRIEFARLRLHKAWNEAGLEQGDPLGYCDFHLTEFADVEAQVERCPLPRRVARRSIELHALRVEMVERNLYLVLINVERYAHTGASRVDLIQEGCLSLFRAVDGFDWRRGLLFRTYAVHWLNQAFRNHLYNFSNTVRVPVYLQKALKHINQAQIRLGDPNATVPEIASTAELTESLVSAAMAAARASYSIDSAVTEDDEGTRLRDLLITEGEEGPYTPGLEPISLQEGLGRALEKLSKRESLVLQMRFGIGMEREHTLAEVAQKLGVSVERVRQIQVRALSKLKTPGLRRELDPWLN